MTAPPAEAPAEAPTKKPAAAAPAEAREKRLALPPRRLSLARKTAVAPVAAPADAPAPPRLSGLALKTAVAPAEAPAANSVGSSAGRASNGTTNAAAAGLDEEDEELRETLSPEKAGDLLGVLGGGANKDAEKAIAEETAAPAKPSGGLSALILAICTCKVPFQ